MVAFATGLLAGAASETGLVLVFEAAAFPAGLAFALLAVEFEVVEFEVVEFEVVAFEVLLPVFEAVVLVVVVFVVLAGLALALFAGVPLSQAENMKATAATVEMVKSLNLIVFVIPPKILSNFA